MNKILDKVNVILYNIMQIVNPLLSPQRGLLISNTFEAGVGGDGGLI